MLLLLGVGAAKDDPRRGTAVPHENGSPGVRSTYRYVGPTSRTVPAHPTSHTFPAHPTSRTVPAYPTSRTVPAQPTSRTVPAQPTSHTVPAPRLQTSAYAGLSAGQVDGAYDGVLEKQYVVPTSSIIPAPRLQTGTYAGLSAGQVDGAYDGLFEKNRLWARQRWMGVQCQQDPSDAWILQEILYDTQPDLLIETGTQNGGGSLFYASLMHMYNPQARVLTIDVQPPHASKPSYFIPGFCQRVGCRNATDSPLWSQHVQYVQGKSTDEAVLAAVRGAVAQARRVMVVLDSLHTYENVVEELRAYRGFVSRGCYLIVQDTKLDRLRHHPYAKAAVHEFMASPAGGDYLIDRSREYLIYSQHHDGFLLRR